jgi:hypothetical protein
MLTRIPKGTPPFGVPAPTDEEDEDEDLDEEDEADGEYDEAVRPP